MSKMPTNDPQHNPQDANPDPNAPRELPTNVTPFNPQNTDRDTKPAVEANPNMPDPRDPESYRTPPPVPPPTKPRRPSKPATNGSTPPPGSEDLTKPSAPVAKPKGSSLDKFRSKRAGTIANVGTVPAALPHHKLSEAKDFVRLHPDKENYWSPELCFVMVPVPGMKNPVLHLITEEIAERYLTGGKVQRFRLALASKPLNHFFLCQVPSQNLENSWNQSNLAGCEHATTHWVSLTSRKESEGIESYKLDFARDQDAFPDPDWTARTLGDLLDTTFAGRMIDHDDHPALLRLIGAKQKTS